MKQAEVYQFFDRIKTKADLDVVREVYNVTLRRITKLAADKFYPGQRVVFTARGKDYTGIIQRINTKTISIDTDPTGSAPSEKWRVSPTKVMHAQPNG